MHKLTFDLIDPVRANNNSIAFFFFIFSKKNPLITIIT